MPKMLPIDRGALRLAIEQSGASRRTLGDRIAAVLDDPDLAHSIAVTLSYLDSGKVATVTPDRLRAIEQALGRADGDLAAPVLWTFRHPLGRPIPLGLTLPLFSTRDAAIEGRGVLSGVRVADAARGAMHTADPSPMFASDREQWLDQNFDALDEREHALVIAVDPDERALMRLWFAHLATVHDKPKVRALVLERLDEFVEQGTFEPIDFAALADIAARRLECDRLRDAPATVYEQWRAEAANLAAAAAREGAAL